MANKKLKTIQFPGLPDTYTVPQVENGTNNNVAALDGAGNVKDSAIEVSKVAKTDGSYQNLNAGTSDQLNASVGVTDEVPYNFRTSGGSADIGNRLNDKIVGGTIAWNQWSKLQDATLNAIPHETHWYILFNEDKLTVPAIKTHKYYLSYDYEFETDDTIAVPPQMGIGFGISTFSKDLIPSKKYAGLSGSFNFIFNAEDDVDFYGEGKSNLYFRPLYIPKGNGTFYKLSYANVQLFDITQMFGSAIANYIYSLEQTKTGAGVALFKNLFPKPYYEYNAVELMSVCTNAHITRGFNAYDSATGMAKLIGGKQYQITGAFASLAYSTGETITPDTNGLFTPTENGVLTITGGNSSTTCVHLTWSGYRNGEYAPYVENRYPLSALELRGIPKLDTSNNLYFDGDTYEKDGTVTRRYGIVDLGTIDWEQGGAGDKTSWVPVSWKNNIKPSIVDEYPNIICPIYDTETSYNVERQLTDKTITVSQGGWVYIYDSLYKTATASEFKAAMSGVYLVYELETTTTETANPFTDPQIVDDFGTEEYVDALATAETSPRDVEVPVGHETFYQANLRDKLQNLPVNASANGLYLVKQTGNKQELIAYTPESELPTSPAETGTYVLKLVDGTLTWVLES